MANDKTFIGFCTRCAKAGNCLATHMPSTSGTPSSMTMTSSISHGLIATSFISPAVMGCRLPQKAKFSGVMNSATTVDNALTLTDRAVLPLEWCTRKLEMCPAGQLDTRIMPRAMLGSGFRMDTST